MSLFPPDLMEAAEAVLDACRARGWRLATVESCTGGLISAVLTEVPGSSAVVERGLITYANIAKQMMAGVRTELLTRHGAVSEPVARAMAEGGLRASTADLTVAVTGVAGPGGGTPDKPVGLVWFATAVRDGETQSHVERFGDLGRSAVRLASVRTALRLLGDRARTAPA
jgi:nicotinamide-nucleotide amidase